MSRALGLERQQKAEELHRRLSSGPGHRNRGRRFLLAAAWALSVAALSGVKRAIDILVSLLLLGLTSPVWIFSLAVSRPQGKILMRTVRAGRWAHKFEEYSFAVGGTPGALLKTLHLNRVPALWNVVCGEMSLIGPRAVVPEEIGARERIARRRFDVRPGFICLWWVRKRANINYGHETLSDLEYVESHGVMSDFGLAIRAVPALLYGRGVEVAPDELDLVGIRIHNLTMSEAVETIVSWGDQSAGDHTPRQVAFVNADCANLAWKNPEYAAVLEHADLTLGDGIGIKAGAAALGLQLKQNVNGTDLFPRLCDALQGRKTGVFLLGARPGVVGAVSEWVQAHYPGVFIAGSQHGYFSPAEEQDVFARIRASRAGILLVALGSPHQDLWIRKNLAMTGVGVAMGVGGLFDFFSGRIPRAPQWLREMGLEWVYRLYQEPQRMWRRYLIGNLTFLYHVGLHRYRGSGEKQSANKGNQL